MFLMKTQLRDYGISFVCNLFSLADFKTLLIFDILIICLDVVFFGFILFGDLCASWTYMSFSPGWETFQQVFLQMFSALIPLSSPSGTII